MNAVILKYTDKKDLTSKILLKYLHQMKHRAALLKALLADQNWASDGSEYHAECRKNAEDELAEIKKQTGLLSADIKS